MDLPFHCSGQGSGKKKMIERLKNSKVPIKMIGIQHDFFPMTFDPVIHIKLWDKDTVVIKVVPKNDIKLSDIEGKATFPNGSSVRVGTHKVRIKDLPLWMGICNDLDGLISEIFQ